MERERLLRDNTPEKFEARVQAKVEELFPLKQREAWVNEIAAGMLAGFTAQACGM